MAGEREAIERAIEAARRASERSRDGGGGDTRAAVERAVANARRAAGGGKDERPGRSLWEQATDTLWAAPKGLVQFGNELQRGATMPVRLGVDVVRGRNPLKGGAEGFLGRYQPAALHMGQSMVGTGGRVANLGVALAPGGLKPSESEYGRAVAESRIVPTLFEDVGNLSLVAGGAGAAAGRVGRGVAGRAGVPTEILRAEAGKGTAEAVARAGGPIRVAEARRAFGSDYVPEFTPQKPGTAVARDALDAADARVIGEHDLAHGTGVRPGTAEARARTAERGVIEVGPEGPAATRRVVNDAEAVAARQRADHATNRARRLFGAEYPIRQVARMGDRVSGDPSFLAQQIARPFQAANRRVGPPLTRAIEATERGNAALQGLRSWRLAHNTRLEASDAFRGEVERNAQPVVQAMTDASKVLPEPELQVASYMLVDKAVNPEIIEAVNNLERVGGIPKDDVLRDLFDGDETLIEGYRTAEAYMEGTVDLDVRRRMDEAQAILRPTREQRQQRYLRGYGAKEAPTDDLLRRRSEQLLSEPMPSKVEELAGPAERAYDAQAEVVAEARMKADRAAGRRLLTPEQYRTEGTKQVADTYRQARQAALRIVNEHPDVAARALNVEPDALFDVTREGVAVPVPKAALIDRLADSLIVGDRTRSAAVREAFDLATEAGFRPPDLSLRRIGALRPVEQRARAEGEATGLAREADRLADLAARETPQEPLRSAEGFFSPVERQAVNVERARAGEQRARQRGEAAVESISGAAARGARTPDDLFATQRPAPAPGTPEFRERIAAQEPPPEAVSGREAQRRVREVRDDVATRAADAQAAILAEMDSFGYEGGRLAFDRMRQGGEWDFLDGLHPDEVAYLKREWGGGVLDPAQMAEFTGLPVDEAMAKWLHYTREYAELGKLNRRGNVGKNRGVVMPLAGDMSIDANLLWRLGDVDFEMVNRAFDKNIAEGALHLSRTADAARAEWEQKVDAIEGEVRAASEPFAPGYAEAAAAQFEDTWQRVAAGEGDEMDFAAILPNHEADALFRAGVGQPGGPTWFEVVQRKVSGERVLFGDEWVTDLQSRRDTALAAGDAEGAAWVDQQIAGYERVLPDTAADTAVGAARREALEALQAEQEMRAAGVDAPRAETVVSPAAAPIVRQMRAEGRTAAAEGDLAARRERAGARLRAEGARAGAGDAQRRVFGDLSARYGARAERLAEGQLPRYEAGTQVAADIAGRPITQARRAGEREQAARTAESTLGTEERRLGRAQERMDTARQAALANPRAAPARFAGAQTAATRLKETGRKFAAEREKVAPGSGAVLNMIVDDIADTVTALAPKIGEVEHIIGGDVWTAKKGAGSGTPRDFRRARSGEQFEKSRTASEAKRTFVGQSQETLVRVTREARNEVSRLYQGIHGRKAAAVLGPEAEGLRGRALYDAMSDAPIEPGSTHRVRWKASNPGGLFDEVRPEQVGPETIWIPEPIHDAVFKSVRFDDPNLALRIYDAGNNVFRIAWLPLSPRWLTGNVVGNALMGMSEVGVTPFLRAMPEAWRMVKSGEMPSRLGNRGFTRSQRDMLYANIDATRPVGRVRGLARAGIEKSFAMNEFVDNVARSSVFVAAKKGGASRSQAIKRALRAAGDFQRMTPFERNVIKRTWLFWPWYKHITKLTFSLPVNHPHRVAWTGWLGSVFGDPEEQAGLPKFLRGSIPLGEDRYIPIGGLNPFSSGVNSPLLSAEGATRSVAPFPQLPFIVLLGKDPGKALADVARPPGSMRLGEGGGEKSTPLYDDPAGLAYFLASEFPQLRLLQQTGVGRRLMGAPAPDANVVRYPTGQPWFFAGGEAAPTGRTPAGELAGFFGAPYPMTADVAAMKERHEQAVGRRSKSDETYRRRVRDLERR